MDNIIRLPTGQLRIARVVYFTDLIHSDSRELPVGVIAEVALPDLTGIGTALRASFSAPEYELMGPTARGLLADPIEHFWPVILEEFERTPTGRTLERLLARYASSLSILAPETIEVPRQWLTGQQDLDSVQRRFHVALEDEYYKFLFPPRETAPGIPAIQEEMKQAA
jgi:hypothetical protein